MSRSPKTNPAPIGDGITDAHVDAAQARFTSVSTELTLQTNNAQALAAQLGYEGALTVGALEDEIRFYQKQTVAALLETGARLLMLKELTPHGEFQQRVELLGFGYRTAATFMSAALKTSKSETAALLSGRAKNPKAFLELITHDDDVIENLAEMDDFERMSASEVRAAARSLKAEKDDLNAQVERKDKKINELDRKLTKKVAALTDWPDAFSPLFDQAAGAHRQIEKGFADLEIITRTALAVEPEPGEEEGRDKAFAAIANQMADTLATAHKLLAAADLLFTQTLEAWTPKV